MISARGAGCCAAALAAALATLACGGLGGQPPERPPVVEAPNGQSYYFVDRSPYKAYYDVWGRLDHLEFDSNGDGRPDRITRHRDGAKRPHRIESDVDFDGRTDRWDDFDEAGTLVRFAVGCPGDHPQLWTVVGPSGQPYRYEHDADGDGRPERVEIVEEGRIARIELDTDRDGRADRWQEWSGGRMARESLDIDQDGKPDRRLSYGPKGAVTGIERLSP
jgi:hypothetical protein